MRWITTGTLYMYIVQFASDPVLFSPFSNRRAPYPRMAAVVFGGLVCADMSSFTSPARRNIHIPCFSFSFWHRHDYRTQARKGNEGMKFDLGLQELHKQRIDRPFPPAFVSCFSFFFFFFLHCLYSTRTLPPTCIIELGRWQQGKKTLGHEGRTHQRQHTMGSTDNMDWERSTSFCLAGSVFCSFSLFPFSFLFPVLLFASQTFFCLGRGIEMVEGEQLSDPLVLGREGERDKGLGQKETTRTTHPSWTEKESKGKEKIHLAG